METKQAKTKTSDGSKYSDPLLLDFTGDDEYDENVFSPKAEIASEFYEEDESTLLSEDDLPTRKRRSKDHKAIWLDSSIKYLIVRAKALRPEVGSSLNLKNNKLMFKQISDELCAKGYNLNPSQVETKLFSLKRKYKKGYLNKKTPCGRNRAICPFQSELNELFCEEKSWSSPTYALDNEEPITTEDINPEESTNPLCEPETSDCVPSTAKIRNANFEKLIKIIDAHAARRHKQNEILLTMLQESLTKKEERESRKEEREIKKLKLLKAILNTLKK